MWFKLLMLVQLCAAFPLKCPEPAQWTLRANGHCADPSKYFCLKNDLINGYSENCTRSDFQQPGRKSVLRGGIDADICSLKRYQPFPITFYTNVSTNCIFLKSVCNEEGQVVYDHGNRNTDTTCSCDYRQGYDFLVKPNNPCFCKASQEDCSCYLKTCSNTSLRLSADYQCMYKTDINVATQCRPIPEEDISKKRTEIVGNIPVEQNSSFKALEIKSPESEIHLIEGESLKLRYKLSMMSLFSRKSLQLSFFKNNNFIAERDNLKKQRNGRLNILTIMNVTPKDEGLYTAQVNGIQSQVTEVTVQSMFTNKFASIYCIEGEYLHLKCSLYSEEIGVQWFKNGIEIKENENVSITSAGTDHQMTFKYAKVSDTGRYSVIARNVQKQLTVTVQALFKRPLKDKTIMEGLEVSFECEVENPYPVVWYKDNKEVYPSSDIKIDSLQQTVHKLTILQTTLKNKGRYEIKINNILSGANLDVKEMPDAIKEMDENDRSVFLEAAKNGIAVRFNIRIILVGKQGVGKTCLLRRLMSEGIADVESTDGINIEVKKCKINVHTKEWIFNKGNESSLSEYPNDQFADCGFWDFAGQKEFYATHQTFLSRNAIYLLVVDISDKFEMKTFDNMIENQFESTGEYIDFWLDNIHCYTVNDTDKSRTIKSDLLNPPVIIIGTGIDKVQDEGKTKVKFEKFINNLLRQHPKRKHLRKLCFLSNTKPSKDKKEFQTLRNDIFDRANEIPKWGDNLPTRWILLEKEIERLIDKAKFVISYDIAKLLASKCSFSVEEVTLELDSFLKYEHEIGNLIYFENIKSYIILEPKWLVDVFKCFVSPFQFQSQSINMSEWSDLQSTGRLSNKLIEKLFTKVQVLNSIEHKAFALQIMEQFDIIVKPITTDNTEEYYMPCMMEASAFNQILDTFNVRNIKCARTSWFGLQFNFLPPAFFNHILVTFLKKYSLCTVGERRLAIYRGVGVFDLEASKCRKLVVCLSENSVALQVWQFKKEEGICYHKNRKYLTQIVELLQQKYRINIPYQCFLKCPDGTHHGIAERIYLNEVSKNAHNHCSEHAFHTLDELRRFWFDVCIICWRKEIL
ncbi:unnamed protein product [Mytilus coruscus]|uniref:non-specific serine/threonine protein kinase n=1 Tax=Mytilus coruscus TaxID=42192 RepID=A0A6J7ZXT4_MYTCO|nr:unnamed protein product [Mytilus coruscus]